MACAMASSRRGSTSSRSGLEHELADQLGLAAPDAHGLLGELPAHRHQVPGPAVVGREAQKGEPAGAQPRLGISLGRTAAAMLAGGSRPVDAGRNTPSLEPK